MEKKSFFITYEEAARLRPIFEAAKRYGPYKEARESAGRILEELRFVRDIDYSLFRGHQILLNGMDHKFLMDTLDQVED